MAEVVDLKPLNYSVQAPGTFPDGDFVFVDPRGSMAPLQEGDDPIARIKYELDAGCLVYIRDQIGRYKTFTIKKKPNKYIVTTSDVPPQRLGTFVDVDAALRCGLTCRGFTSFSSS